jgi:hypothetical protein
MAIVGLKSISPMKFLAGLSATTAVGIGSSLIGAIGASRARKDARRADAEARRRLAEAREEYNAIEFTNPYEGITNPYEGIQSQFTGMENVFEEPQVDTRAADFMREQSQQQQANILSNLRGVAGGSGVAGLAQQISNIGTQQARQAAVDIARQERQSEMARRGEASRIDMLQRQDAQRIDMLQRRGAYQADMLQRKGDMYVQQQEQNRIASLYGLAADRQTGTSQALNTAQTGFSEALGGLGGEIAGGVASGGINLSNFTERGRITNQLNAITPTLVDIGEEEETAQDIPGLIL